MGTRMIYRFVHRRHGMAFVRWCRRHGDTVDVKHRSNGTIDIRVEPLEAS